MLEKHIDQIAPPSANLPAAAARLMFQAQPVFLNAEELSVEREDFGRPRAARRSQLTFRVREDFFEMT